MKTELQIKDLIIRAKQILKNSNDKKLCITAEYTIRVLNWVLGENWVLRE